MTTRHAVLALVALVAVVSTATPAAARPVNATAPVANATTPVANATAKAGNATAKAEDAAAAGCGFLGLFTCNEMTLEFYCRCRTGCRIYTKFALGFDSNDRCGYCNVNCEYNYGRTCSTKAYLRFNGKWAARIKNGVKYTVNGWTYTPDRYSSFTQFRVEPGVYGGCNGY